MHCMMYNTVIKDDSKPSLQFSAVRKLKVENNSLQFANTVFLIVFRL